MRSEGGQATVEWVGVVLLVALSLGALLSLATRVDGRALGVLISQRVTGHQARTPTRRLSRPMAPAAPAGLALGRGGAWALVKAGARKGVALNGLVCYLRKSAAPNDTNRVGDDIADAVNCMNPIEAWTGYMPGTDDD
jgi:hypothetical protein